MKSDLRGKVKNIRNMKKVDKPEAIRVGFNLETFKCKDCKPFTVIIKVILAIASHENQMVLNLQEVSAWPVQAHVNPPQSYEKHPLKTAIMPKASIQGAFNRLKPEAGRILISEPFAHDFFFGRSVVLLAEHNQEGSLGVVTNKPLKIKISSVFPDLSGYDDVLYLGGPVKRDNILFIHTIGESVPDSLRLPGGFYWGGDLNRIKHLITAGVAAPSNLRFFMGYSGWSPGQLEGELQRRSWVIAPSDKDILMDNHSEQIWRKSVLSAGKQFAHWINYPIQPELN